MQVSEFGVTAARVKMSEIIRAANNCGQIIYLTNNGLRVAAVVPCAVADAALAAQHPPAPEAAA